MTALKDIAQACGTSVATVSKALRGYQDVSEETRQHILMMAKQMGYVSKTRTITPAPSGNRSIGVIYQDRGNLGLTHDYFSVLLEQFKQTVWDAGYDLTLIAPERAQINRSSILEQCRRRNLDGVLIVCTDYENPEIGELVHSEVPTVTIDHVFSECCAVTSDNGEGLRAQMEYVLDRGHRQIAYVHGEASSVTRARLTSYYIELAMRDIQVPDSYVRSASYRNMEEARSETRQLMHLIPPPTCILYSDDVSAMGGIQWLKDHGYTIGKDISVVGYDGGIFHRAACPELTSYEQDVAGIGRLAAERMLALIEHPGRVNFSHDVVKGRLIEGDTVAKLN